MEINKKIPVTFESIGQISDSRFTKVKIWLMHTGKNLNGSVFNKGVVDAAISTLANTPILGFIEQRRDGEDFSTHKSQVVKKDGEWGIKYVGSAYGVIPENNNAMWETKVGSDGVEREYLTCEGLMWNKWDDPIDIMNRDFAKSQSMELHDDYEGFFDDNNDFNFTKFSFFGACILGEGVQPAMVDASVQIEFSTENVSDEIKKKLEEFNKVIMMAKSSDSKQKIEVDNSKDSANMSGSWGDVDKTALRNELINASNAASLVKEAYLIVDSDWEKAPSEALHYPHHVVENGKLVVHKAGLQAAFSRLEQNDPNNTSAINHLKKHYKELGLDTSNFAKEGGNVVEKNELLNKYSVTVEQLSEIGIDFEQISAEELATKLEEFASKDSVGSQMDSMMSMMDSVSAMMDKTDMTDAQKKKMKKMMDNLKSKMGDVKGMMENMSAIVANEFSVSAQQLATLFQDRLNPNPQMSDYGYPLYDYQYVDHTDSMVVAIALQDDYVLVGFDYTVDGDVPVINFDSKTKLKVTYEPLQGDTAQEMFSLKPIIEYESTKVQKTLENQVETANAKVSEFTAQVEGMNAELAELKEYKTAKTQEERKNSVDELFAKFASQLPEEDMSEFKTSCYASTDSIETIENQLFALVGKKFAKFSAAQPAKKTVKIGVEIPVSSGKPYDGLLTRHLNK